MKLILDNIIFYLQKSGGGSVYWSENIKRIDKMSFDTQYCEPKSNFDNIFYATIQKSLGHSKIIESYGAKLLSFLPFSKKIGTKYIFHSSYYRVSRESNAINIVTIHDFMPELFFQGIKRLVHSYRKKIAITKADAIVCVSENTRKDLLRFYPKVSRKPIITIHLGIANDFSRLTTTPSEYNRFGKFILFVGRRSHYKNFSFAVSVMEKLPNYQLVVVGEEFSEAENGFLKSIRNRVTLISNPSNDILNVLYNSAFCLLYPSSYEGFGIPVIEAMKCGCPVVALKASSIPEIAGSAGILIDTLDSTSFSKAIISLENQEYRKLLVQEGIKNSSRFNWDNSCASLIDFYKEIWNLS